LSIAGVDGSWTSAAGLADDDLAAADVATTTTLYDLPLVSLRMVQEVAVAATQQVPPPGPAVAV
jgi:hypothetical protein